MVVERENKYPLNSIELEEINNENGKNTLTPTNPFSAFPYNSDTSELPYENISGASIAVSSANEEFLPISSGVYNPLSCELEFNNVERINRDLRSVFSESLSEETTPLQRENELFSQNTLITNYRSRRKKCAFWIIITTLLGIILSSVVTFIVKPSILSNLFNSANLPNESEIQNNWNPPNFARYKVFKKDLLNPETEEKHSEENTIKYGLNPSVIKIRKPSEKNLFLSHQAEQEKHEEEQEFPIPDDKTRQEKEFKKELYSNTKYSHSSNESTRSTSEKKEVELVYILLDNIANGMTKTADDKMVRDGMEYGKKELQRLHIIERQIKKLGFITASRSPESFQQAFKKSSEEARQLGLTGFAMIKASIWMAKRLNMSKTEAQQGILSSNLLTTEPNEWCTKRQALKRKRCDALNPYRSIDGICNNLLNPMWGSAFQTFRRILIPDYADGITDPKIALDGSPLPNARHVSKTLIIDRNIAEKQASMIVALWGQFVAYDLSNTVQTRGKNNARISCCENGVLVKMQHPECFPIYINETEQLFKQFNKNHRCTTFLRSAPAPVCYFGPREQFNEYTSYLDASNIYGSFQSKTDLIKDITYGRLKVFPGYGDRSMLPIDTDEFNECNTQIELRKAHYCFKSGDERTNANIGLTSMHTIWLRQHNSIALILHSMNSDWTHNRLFEETRRIVIAQIQHITYNEFLPILLGTDLVERAGLSLVKTGYYKNYDVTIDATLSNVFSTVANRYGHSMLQGLFQMIGQRGKNIDYSQIHKFFFNPFPLWEEKKLDAILRGHFTGTSGIVDTMFPKQVTNQMFQKDNYTHGLDIVAINIQRGRDHGIPGYTAWRNSCKLSSIISFEDLYNIWDKEVVELIQRVYKSVHDIDLYIGGLAEKHVKGGLVGPTFGCLIADQFSRVRKGDRFWYEGEIYVQPFTPEQLREIRQITLARILCLNGDDLYSIQSNIFKYPTNDNPIGLCDGGSIPKIDYTPWQGNNKPIKQTIRVIPYMIEDETLLNDNDTLIIKTIPPSKENDVDPYANITYDDTSSED